MNYTLHLSALVLTIALLTAPASAEITVTSHDAVPLPLTGEDNRWTFEGSVGVELSSKQLTYGLIDNPHAILTPSVELAFTHPDWFTIALGAEAIFDTTNWGAKEGGYNNRRYKYQEFAPGITLSRAWQTEDWLGSTLETSINYTYEYHPDSCKKPALDYANPNTQWLNLEIGAPDFWLQPTFTVEYQLVRQGAEDEHNGKGGLYATFSIAHDFDIGSTFGATEGVLTLTPTLGLGMANKKRNLCDFGDMADETFMFRDGFASLELAYVPFEGFKLAPYVACHQQLASTARDATGDDDFVALGGIGLSYTF